MTTETNVKYNKKYHQEYYQKNKEKLIKKMAEYRKANRDKINADERARYRRRKENISTINHKTQ